MFKRYYIKFLILLSMTIITTHQSVYAQPDILWTKTFGGVDFDVGFCVQQTVDGGFIITGQTNSYGTSSANVWLIKTDLSGDTIWTKTIGTFVGLGGSGNSIQQTSDGGYFITGSTVSIFSDVLIIKTNASGDTLWTKTFGGIADDGGYCGQQTSDGGYIITGYKYGSNYYDVWLIKTDASGNTVWTKTFGGTEFVKDMGRFVQQTSDGGYIIAGYTNSYGAGSYDVWLIKTDALGDTAWTKTFGGSSYDEGYSVQQTTDGGYIVAGVTWSYGAGLSDVWLIKTNASGDTTWTKTFGGSARDVGRSVQQTSDGGYIITGMTHSYGAGGYDFWLIKTDTSGNMVWTKTFGGSVNDEGYYVRQTADDGYVITGFTKSYGAGDNDLWLIRIAPDTALIAIENNLNLNPSSFLLYQNYPNPFNPLTTIYYTLPRESDVTITIYDILGRKVQNLISKKEIAGNHSFQWNGTDQIGNPVSAGIYLYQIQAGDFIQTKKMVLTK